MIPGIFVLLHYYDDVVVYSSLGMGAQTTIRHLQLLMLDLPIHGHSRLVHGLLVAPLLLLLLHLLLLLLHDHLSL